MSALLMQLNLGHVVHVVPKHSTIALCGAPGVRQRADRFGRRYWQPNGAGPSCLKCADALADLYACIGAGELPVRRPNR